jgi:hypothetical protein
MAKQWRVGVFVGFALILTACSQPSATPTRSETSTVPSATVSTDPPNTTFTTLPTQLHIGGTATVSSVPFLASVVLQRYTQDPVIRETASSRPVKATVGARFVALMFSVTNTGSTQFMIGGQEHETNLTAIVVTTNGQMLSPVRSLLVENCMDLGSLALAPGMTATGCQVFEIATHSSVTYVSAQMFTGLGGTYGSWRVP